MKKTTLIFNYRLAYIWVLLALVLLQFSCGVIPRGYPKDQPFVYKNNVKLIGNFSNDEREVLISRLKGQLDDSIQVRTVPKLFYSVLRHPPVYNSANADRSVLYMRALLNSIGYFRDSIRYDTITTLNGKDQKRTTVSFSVKPGKAVLLDSVSYNLQDSSLQKLSLANTNDSYLKKGALFAKSTISMEIDRLVELYRNNGYLKFNREELVGIWDTLDVNALKPSSDPIEQLRVMQLLQEKQEHPTANLELKLRAGYDTSKLKKFYIGNITIYPEYSADTVGYSQKLVHAHGMDIYNYKNQFHHTAYTNKIHFERGDLYNQQNYNKTLNQLNALGTWKLVAIEPIPRTKQDTTDILIRLTPNKKRELSTNIEGSSNQSIISGSLLGLAVNFGIQNRNIARRAIQSNTNIRLGVETGKDTLTNVNFIQTSQFVFSHSLYFPRVIPNIPWISPDIKDNFKSVLALNIASTKRRELFDLQTFNASWGYDFRHKNALYSLRIPNIEFNTIKRKPKLEELIQNNGLLRNIFADGFISSVSAGVNITKERKKQIGNYRFNIEESGLLTGIIHNKLFDSNLYRFIKIDVDLSHKIVFKKSALAMRFFTGVGYEFESTVNENKRYSLPLFRQYFAGGPNSMRAWGIRKLGPGSSIQEYGNRGLPERYGDLQLETNIEYRFPFFTLAGFKVNGALYSDIGNVWYVKKAPGRKPEEIFNFNRLGKDIAVGVGTGLRVNFEYFVIRLDYSIKAKDPCPSPANRQYQNKWFGYERWSDMDQFQLGINYPFIL
jgi:hypothetical protein